MVVEIISDIGLYGFLSVCLLYELFYDQVNYYRYCVDDTIFWLYPHHGIPILLAYWNCGILGLLLVCP